MLEVYYVVYLLVSKIKEEFRCVTTISLEETVMMKLDDHVFCRHTRTHTLPLMLTPTHSHTHNYSDSFTHAYLHSHNKALSCIYVSFYWSKQV
jgi:hypothetical protein